MELWGLLPLLEASIGTETTRPALGVLALALAKPTLACSGVVHPTKVRNLRKRAPQRQLFYTLLGSGYDLFILLGSGYDFTYCWGPGTLFGGGLCRACGLDIEFL